MIDFRSDTVTQPTQAMRTAMANAIVGDDVYGDDPTINELEQYAAQLVGKEASLFVPSGTFGNQLALFTHCNRGNEVLLADDCHIVQHEAGAAAVISGAQLRTLNTQNGKMDLVELESKIRVGNDIHFPISKLICLENAHSSGALLDIEYMKAVHAIAGKHQVSIHLDGARLFNGATALGVDVKDITSNVDTVMFCLSKGLCAPVGSIVAGDKKFIEKARRNRKIMGGGMRQAGILGAAGLIALKEMRERLTIDHDHAKYLATELGKIQGILVSKPDINLVFFQLPLKVNSEGLVRQMYESGILVNGPENGMMRLVTHYWVGKTEIDKCVQVLRTYVEASL